jgi:hypothetical protein
MITSFLEWVLRTVTTAAEAEMNDDTMLREQLLEAETRRDAGEISGDEFRAIERDLLKRIREIRDRRVGGATAATGPIEMSRDRGVQIEASVTGDFYEPADAPHTVVVETEPDLEERISVVDLVPAPTRGAARTSGTRTTRTSRTPRTTRTSRTTRAPRTFHRKPPRP